MSSTHKTGHLLLNKWLGSDKPKKDDFNSDNDKIDSAVASISDSVGSMSSIIGSLAGHADDANIHVTEEEKAMLSGAGGGSGSGDVTIGTYVGTGTITRAVTVGFRPRFGFIFGLNQAVVDGDWNLGESYMYAGFLSSEGCSKYIAITDDGMTVNHHPTAPLNGTAAKLNQTGSTYIYVLWK